MTSLRIVCLDFHTSPPIRGLDPLNSEFRGSTVVKVPILRVFGTTNKGYKACLHIHGVFPYVYVPYDSRDNPNAVSYQMANALDKALNISMGQASSNQQHIYKIELVSAFPFYGYHTRQHQFLKISFYNPLMIKKACALLENGSILGKIFQPYESHIPYHQQFMIDYNLHGMNSLRLSKVQYRTDPSTCDEWIDPACKNDVKKMSVCRIEMDALAEDILNRLEVSQGKVTSNPGIQYICEDEKQRRRNKGVDTQLETCLTQNRNNIEPTITHTTFKKVLQAKLEDKKLSGDSFLSDTSVYPAETPNSHSILEEAANNSILEDAELLMDMLRENAEPDSILSQTFKEIEESDEEQDLTLPLQSVMTPVKVVQQEESDDDIWNDSFFDKTLVPQLDGAFDRDEGHTYNLRSHGTKNANLNKKNTERDGDSNPTSKVNRKKHIEPPSNLKNNVGTTTKVGNAAFPVPDWDEEDLGNKPQGNKPKISNSLPLSPYKLVNMTNEECEFSIKTSEEMDIFQKPAETSFTSEAYIEIDASDEEESANNNKSRKQNNPIVKFPKMNLLNRINEIEETNGNLDDASNLKNKAEIASNLKNEAEIVFNLENKAGVASNLKHKAGIASNLKNKGELNSKLKNKAEVASNLKNKAEIAPKPENKAGVASNLKHRADIALNLKNKGELTSKLKNKAEVASNLKNKAEMVPNLENKAGVASNLKHKADIASNLKNKGELNFNLENKAGIASNLKNKAEIVPNLENKAGIASNLKHKADIASNLKNKGELNSKLKNEAEVAFNLKNKAEIVLNLENKAGVASNLKHKADIASKLKNKGELNSNLENKAGIASNLKNKSEIVLNLKDKAGIAFNLKHKAASNLKNKGELNSNLKNKAEVASNLKNNAEIACNLENKVEVVPNHENNPESDEELMGKKTNESKTKPNEVETSTQNLLAFTDRQNEETDEEEVGRIPMRKARKPNKAKIADIDNSNEEMEKVPKEKGSRLRSQAKTAKMSAQNARLSCLKEESQDENGISEMSAKKIRQRRSHAIKTSTDVQNEESMENKKTSKFSTPRLRGRPSTVNVMKTRNEEQRREETLAQKAEGQVEEKTHATQKGKVEELTREEDILAQKEKEVIEEEMPMQKLKSRKVASKITISSTREVRLKRKPNLGLDFIQYTNAEEESIFDITKAEARARDIIKMKKEEVANKPIANEEKISHPRNGNKQKVIKQNPEETSSQISAAQSEEVSKKLSQNKQTVNEEIHEERNKRKLKPTYKVKLHEEKFNLKNKKKQTKNTEEVGKTSKEEIHNQRKQTMHEEEKSSQNKETVKEDSSKCRKQNAPEYSKPKNRRRQKENATKCNQSKAAVKEEINNPGNGRNPTQHREESIEKAKPAQNKPERNLITKLEEQNASLDETINEVALNVNEARDEENLKSIEEARSISEETVNKLSQNEARISEVENKMEEDTKIVEDTINSTNEALISVSEETGANQEDLTEGKVKLSKQRKKESCNTANKVRSATVSKQRKNLSVSANHSLNSDLDFFVRDKKKSRQDSYEDIRSLLKKMKQNRQQFADAAQKEKPEVSPANSAYSEYRDKTAKKRKHKVTIKSETRRSSSKKKRKLPSPGSAERVAALLKANAKFKSGTLPTFLKREPALTSKFDSTWTPNSMNSSSTQTNSLDNTLFKGFEDKSSSCFYKDETTFDKSSLDKDNSSLNYDKAAVAEDTSCFDENKTNCGKDKSIVDKNTSNFDEDKSSLEGNNLTLVKDNLIVASDKASCSKDKTKAKPVKDKLKLTKDKTSLVKRSKAKTSAKEVGKKASNLNEDCKEETKNKEKAKKTSSLDKNQNEEEDNSFMLQVKTDIQDIFTEVKVDEGTTKHSIMKRGPGRINYRKICSINVYQKVGSENFVGSIGSNFLVMKRKKPVVKRLRKKPELCESLSMPLLKEWEPPAPKTRKLRKLKRKADFQSLNQMFTDKVMMQRLDDVISQGGTPKFKCVPKTVSLPHKEKIHVNLLQNILVKKADENCTVTSQNSVNPQEVELDTGNQNLVLEGLDSVRVNKSVEDQAQNENESQTNNQNNNTIPNNQASLKMKQNSPKNQLNLAKNEQNASKKKNSPVLNNNSSKKSQKLPEKVSGFEEALLQSENVASLTQPLVKRRPKKQRYSLPVKRVISPKTPPRKLLLKRQNHKEWSVETKSPAKSKSPHNLPKRKCAADFFEDTSEIPAKLQKLSHSTPHVGKAKKQNCLAESWVASPVKPPLNVSEVGTAVPEISSCPPPALKSQNVRSSCYIVRSPISRTSALKSKTMRAPTSALKPILKPTFKTPTLNSCTIPNSGLETQLPSNSGLETRTVKTTLNSGRKVKTLIMTVPNLEAETPPTLKTSSTMRPPFSALKNPTSNQTSFKAPSVPTSQAFAPANSTTRHSASQYPASLMISSPSVETPRRLGISPLPQTPRITELETLVMRTLNSALKPLAEATSTIVLQPKTSKHLGISTITRPLSEAPFATQSLLETPITTRPLLETQEVKTRVLNDSRTSWPTPITSGETLNLESLVQLPNSDVVTILSTDSPSTAQTFDSMLISENVSFPLINNQNVNHETTPRRAYAASVSLETPKTLTVERQTCEAQTSRILNDSNSAGVPHYDSFNDYLNEDLDYEDWLNLSEDEDEKGPCVLFGGASTLSAEDIEDVFGYTQIDGQTDSKGEGEGNNELEESSSSSSAELETEGQSDSSSDDDDDANFKRRPRAQIDGQNDSSSEDELMKTIKDTSKYNCSLLTEDCSSDAECSSFQSTEVSSEYRSFRKCEGSPDYNSFRMKMQTSSSSINFFSEDGSFKMNDELTDSSEDGSINMKKRRPLMKDDRRKPIKVPQVDGQNDSSSEGGSSNNEIIVSNSSSDDEEVNLLKDKRSSKTLEEVENSPKPLFVEEQAVRGDSSANDKKKPPIKYPTLNITVRSPPKPAAFLGAGSRRKAPKQKKSQGKAATKVSVDCDSEKASGRPSKDSAKRQLSFDPQLLEKTVIEEKVVCHYTPTKQPAKISQTGTNLKSFNLVKGEAKVTLTRSDKAISQQVTESASQIESNKLVAKTTKALSQNLAEFQKSSRQIETPQISSNDEDNLEIRSDLDTLHNTSLKRSDTNLIKSQEVLLSEDNLKISSSNAHDLHNSGSNLIIASQEARTNLIASQEVKLTSKADYNLKIHNLDLDRSRIIFEDPIEEFDQTFTSSFILDTSNHSDDLFPKDQEELTEAERYDIATNFAAQPGPSKFAKISQASSEQTYATSSSGLLTPYQRFETPESSQSTLNTTQLSLEETCDFIEPASDGGIYLAPKFKPPSVELIKSTLSTYNLPEIRAKDPFYSDAKHVTGSVEVGHSVLKIKSKWDCPVLGSFAETQRQRLQNLHSDLDVGKNINELKLAYCSQDEFVIEPVRRPPSYREAELWLQARNIRDEAKIVDLDEECSLQLVLEQSELFTEQSINNSRQITGIDQTHDFKLSLENLQQGRSYVIKQYLTSLVMELHIQTRGDLKPDPQHDAIRAIFYSLMDDDGTKLGIIAVNTQNISPGKNSSSNILDGTGINCDVIYVGTEKELYVKFLELIRIWDPDIFIGYEIQMSSWGYLIDRGYTLSINYLTQLSRIPDHTPFKHDEESHDLNITGRVVLDFWRLMRHEIALQSYTFENIVYHALHERAPLYSLRDLTNWWIHRNPKMRHRTVDFYLYRVQRILRIIDNFDLIGRTSELARLFGILFYEVLSRGSQFRVESMMLRLAKPLGFIPVSPNVQQRAKMRAPEYLPLILEPESKFYKDPVIVLDFQSLYPSVIIAYNYCFSTCIGRVEHLGTNSPFEFGATQLKVPRATVERLLRKNQLNFSPCGIGFVTKNVRHGILPRMLHEILDTRLLVKQSMKDEKGNKILQRVLHSRQLGLKLIANVTYGYTAANFSGRMPAVEIGDSVVAKGRETLQRAITLVEQNEEWRARVVYGDTDSMFVLVPGRSREDAFKIGAEIAEAVTNDNPSPIRLKLEKVYQPCILQTKKRYVGYMYESAEQAEPEYEAKGIETVRRDGCPAVTTMLEKCLRLLFETCDVSLVRKYVERQFHKLLLGRASIQDLTFAKEYRGMAGYKPGACIPALELVRKWKAADPRNEPRSGERVPYVIINGPPGLPLIKLVRSPRELLEDSALRPNALYYITKAIIPPINRCFLLIGADVNTWFNEMPRKHTQYLPTTTSPSKGPKTTISQYFATTSCICCGQQTKEGVCAKCWENKQSTAVILQEKVRIWERDYYETLKICQSCCNRSMDLSCVSLDCPVLYRTNQARKDLQQTTYVRELINKLPYLEF